MRTRFNSITVAIPAQKFDIRCHVSLERSVPVMTEFAIRLLHIVGAMTLEQVRDYFGLDNHEVRELIGILKAENLIDEECDTLCLSSYAMTRFESSTDEAPRFTSIVERRKQVTFELLTFRHLPRDVSSAHTNCALELKLPANLNYENTVEQAERAFVDQFYDIERLGTTDEQKRAFDVYKVDEITANRRFNLPYAVHFEVDFAGQVEQVFDEQLNLSPELKELLESSVSDTVHATKPPGKENVSKFAREFKDELIRSFVQPDGFAFSDYVSKVHATRNIRYSTDDVFPFFGAAYLPGNVDTLKKLLKGAIAKFKEIHKGEQVHPTLYWLAPRVELWGRTKLLGDALDEITTVGRTELANKQFGVCVIRQQQQRLSKRELSANGDSGVRDLLFCEPKVIDARYELLVLPGVVALALYYVGVPSTVGSVAPIGFCTTNQDQIKIAEAILHGVTLESHSRYTRQTRDERFEEVGLKQDEFSFLNVPPLK